MQGNPLFYSHSGGERDGGEGGGEGEGEEEEEGYNTKHNQPGSQVKPST